jgi:hypothetical protein
LEPFAPSRTARVDIKFAAAVLCCCVALAGVPPALAAPEPDPAPQAPSVSPDPAPGAEADPPAQPPQEPPAQSEAPGESAPPAGGAPPSPSQARQPAPGSTQPESTSADRRAARRRESPARRREATAGVIRAEEVALPRLTPMPAAPDTDSGATRHLVPLAAGALLALVVASGAMLSMSTRAMRGDLR